MHCCAVVKQDASATIRMIHRRALWAALEASGGDVDDAANALGITTQHLLTILDGDPASMWTAIPSSGISGTRRKVDAPVLNDDIDPREGGDA